MVNGTLMAKGGQDQVYESGVLEADAGREAPGRRWRTERRGCICDFFQAWPRTRRIPLAGSRCARHERESRMSSDPQHAGVTSAWSSQGPAIGGSVTAKQ